jgi:hypothetical protein
VRISRKVTLLSLFHWVEQLVVRADEKLTVFVELESAIRTRAQLASLAPEIWASADSLAWLCHKLLLSCDAVRINGILSLSPLASALWMKVNASGNFASQANDPMHWSG